MRDTRDWDLEYDRATPPKPESIERKYATRDDEHWIGQVTTRLPTGCYFLRFDPVITGDTGGVPVSRSLAGPLRIHHQKVVESVKAKVNGDSQVGYDRLVTTGSGDLYIVPNGALEKIVDGFSGQSEVQRLQALQLSRDNYRYYLRLKSLWISAPRDALQLTFETYRYDPTARIWQQRQSLHLEWKDEEIKSAGDKATAPVEVTNSFGTKIGTMEILRLSPLKSQDHDPDPDPDRDAILRHATVYIHPFKNIEGPRDEGKWNEILKSANWSVDLVPAEPIAAQKRPRSGWTAKALRELYPELIAKRQKNGAGGVLSSEPDPWIYDLIVVDKITPDPGHDAPLGLMLHHRVDDERNVARAVAAVAADELVAADKPNDLEIPLHEKEGLYYWTAVHELGHMQGLYHNLVDRGVMRPRSLGLSDLTSPPGTGHAGAARLRSQEGPAPTGQPGKSHAEADCSRLRHLPDLWIRPGGIPFGHRYRATAVDLRDLFEATHGLTLSVLPAFVTAGRSLKSLSIQLRTETRYIPRPTHSDVQPHNGCLGALLLGPRDEVREISSVAYPRVFANQLLMPLAPKEVAEYRITWERGVAVREVGVHRLLIFLTWISKNASKGMEVFYVETVAPLHVIEAGGVTDFESNNFS